MFEKIFHLSKHQTNVKTECIAGVTTFMTMAYILAVNPNILSSTGMDQQLFCWQPVWLPSLEPCAWA